MDSECGNISTSSHVYIISLFFSFRAKIWDSL